MRVLDLYRDYNVPHQTEGHKHCRDGWVNTSCPFCTGNPGLHLGATLDGSVFTCWRCGWKPASKAVAELIGVSEPQAKEIMRKYGGTSVKQPKKPEQKNKKPHKFPSDTGPLQPRHKRYLADRRFDPDKLEKKWKLLGTGPVAMLDDISYKHRILAPIFWEGERVSFQARDITDRHKVKYMGCPEDREKIKHKHILYGKQSAWSETGICVEGITDVWRLGTKAFATFGIKFTKKQIRQIAKNFLRVIIMFDDDPQAQKQAKLLEGELQFRGVETKRIDLKGDPADLTEKQAKYLVKKIY